MKKMEETAMTKQPLAIKIPWKLFFAAFCATGAISIMFATLSFAVENLLSVEVFIAIFILSIMLVFSSIILFFAGNDAVQMAFYNFYKEKGGGLCFNLYPSSRRLIWGFYRQVPIRHFFEKRPGQDEPDWAEISTKPWHTANSGTPAYFFREGVPYSIDPINEIDYDIGSLLNKTIVLSELRGKIDALRSFLKKLENLTHNPKILVLIIITLIASAIAAFLCFNVLNLLIAIAEQQGLDPNKYVMLL